MEIHDKIRDKSRDTLAHQLVSVGTEAHLAERGGFEENIGIS